MAANPKRERRRVRCVINGKEIDVWEGYRLWDAALEADARLWKWCGGDGLCGTCAVIPVSGEENLSPPTGLEKFSLALWFVKPLALVRKRWKNRTTAARLPDVRRGARRGRRRARKEGPGGAARPTAWSRPRTSRWARRALPWLTSGGALYLAGSYFAARELADRLLSSRGARTDAGPATTSSCAALEASGPDRGRPSPSRKPAAAGRARRDLRLARRARRRGPTLLFLHGKGGNVERVAAGRAARSRARLQRPAPGPAGPRQERRNVLHARVPREGGPRPDDRRRAGALRHRSRPARRSTPARPGSSVALEFAAGRSGIRAIWLESPFAEPREMARHYLSRATQVPAPLLDPDDALGDLAGGRAGPPRARRRSLGRAGSSASIRSRRSPA